MKHTYFKHNNHTNADLDYSSLDPFSRWQGFATPQRLHYGLDNDNDHDDYNDNDHDNYNDRDMDDGCGDSIRSNETFVFGGKDKRHTMDNDNDEVYFEECNSCIDNDDDDDDSDDDDDLL